MELLLGCVSFAKKIRDCTTLTILYLILKLFVELNKLGFKRIDKNWL
jgi:hypothetical protein